jgi:hypothetical protein
VFIPLFQLFDKNRAAAAASNGAFDAGNIVPGLGSAPAPAPAPMPKPTLPPKLIDPLGLLNPIKEALGGEPFAATEATGVVAAKSEHGN